MAAKHNHMENFLIAKLLEENYDLGELIKDCKESLNRIVNNFVCIGGPLNDNMLEFTKEQRKYLQGILDIAEGQLRELINCDECE